MESISRLPLCSPLLQHTLRSVCMESEWVYAVFWRILPRNFPPPKWEIGRYMDRSKPNKRNWILVWEDGFCDFARSCTQEATTSGAGTSGQASNSSSSSSHMDANHERSAGLHPELFFKMSHEVYNYGEGLMGKVAADTGHKWIHKDPPERENRLVSFWHSSIDPQPRTWEAQFKSGVQTIVVIAVREGLVQIGSTEKVLEDLNFVVMLQREFNNLQQAPKLYPQQPSSHIISNMQHTSPETNMGRKMRHGRQDRDESPFRRTLERRLTWSGTASDARRREGQPETNFPTWNLSSDISYPPSPDLHPRFSQNPLSSNPQPHHLSRRFSSSFLVSTPPLESSLTRSLSAPARGRFHRESSVPFFIPQTNTSLANPYLVASPHSEASHNESKTSIRPDSTSTESTVELQNASQTTIISAPSMSDLNSIHHSVLPVDNQQSDANMFVNPFEENLITCLGLQTEFQTSQKTLHMYLDDIVDGEDQDFRL